MQLDPSVLSEKLFWQKEKAALQAALRKAEDELVKATARNENRPIADLYSNNKVMSKSPGSVVASPIGFFFFFP